MKCFRSILFLLITSKSYSQYLVSEKACDTTVYLGYDSIYFKNNSCASKAYTNGAFFITNIKELKYCLSKKYIETTEGELVEPDFNKSNVIFFTGSKGGFVPIKFSSYQKEDQYVFILSVIYNGIINGPLNYFNQYILIPKNIKKEDIRFLFCEK